MKWTSLVIPERKEEREKERKIACPTLLKSNNLECLKLPNLMNECDIRASHNPYMLERHMIREFALKIILFVDIALFDS
jgi:hypothetical protein